MRKIDSGEYYDVEQFNSFSEYKSFRAEEYYSSETAKSPPEITSVSEFIGDRQSEVKKSARRTDADSGEIRKQIDRMNRSDASFSDSAHTSVSSSSSSASSASASSSVSASAAGSASGTAAVAGVSTAVAAVAILVIATVGLFVNLGHYIRTFLGMDYLTITVDMDAFIAENERSDRLCADDFSIEYDAKGTTRRMVMQSGKHTYLITGLTPGEPFTYRIICTDSTFANSSDYYSETLTVPLFSEPTGVYDEINNCISYDERTKTAAVSYSVYLSDHGHRYQNTTLYICNSEQSDPSDVNNVIHSDSVPDENNFFRGTADGVIWDTLYLYLVGESKEAGKVFLFSHTLDVRLPEGWAAAPPDDNGNTNDAPDDDPSDIFAIDRASEVDSSFINSIAVGGNLIRLDPSFTLGAYVMQYDSEGKPIGERVDAVLTADTEEMTYSVECDAYYGVATYRYVVYFVDDDRNTETVYESDVKTFGADQSFAASYTKITPADATIDRYDGYIVITADPGFSTEYSDIFSYKLQVTDSSGNVFGEYCGTGQAVITVNNCADLDAILFVYYDCAEFMGVPVEYASYSVEGVPFRAANLVLSDVLGFDGTYFTLSYTCDMIYDYASACIDLEITGGEAGYVMNVSDVSESGMIVLETVTGTPGEVTVSAELSYSSESGTRTVRAADVGYDMNYRFSVTNVNADLSDGGSTIPVTVKFDNSFIPGTYRVCITDSLGYVDITVPMSDGYSYFNHIPADSDDAMADDVITVSVKDANGNVWGSSCTYTISQTDAYANYTAPSMMNCVNPGEALVTYNADGTINLYRKVNFSCSNANVYYNAFIYGSYTYDETEGRTVYGDCYDIIGRDTYAVIENIPMREYYCFLYYLMFDYNGVSYTMYTEMPSGSVSFPENCAFAEVTVLDGNTIVTVQLTQYGQLENRIIVNGTEYRYNDYDETNMEKTILTIAGEQDVTSVTVFYNGYTQNYDDIRGDIAVRGNLYQEITIETTSIAS